MKCHLISKSPINQKSEKATIHQRSFPPGLNGASRDDTINVWRTTVVSLQHLTELVVAFRAFPGIYDESSGMLVCASIDTHGPVLVEWMRDGWSAPCVHASTYHGQSCSSPATEVSPWTPDGPPMYCQPCLDAKKAQLAQV